MKKCAFWSITLLLLLVVLVPACSSGQPTPTAKPATSAPASPTAKPATSVPPAVSPKPTTSAKPAASGVSLAGKTVTIVVGSGPGAGTDIVARFYARHLPRFLPGNPSMIVRNMPGGGYTIGPNYVYQSKPDGLTLLACGSSVLMAYVTRVSAAKFDFQKMEGIMAVKSGNFYYAKPGLIKSLEDLPTAKGIIAGYTPAPGWLFVTVVNVLGMKPDKLVIAYPSSSDARRAFLAGEINFTQEGVDTYWEVFDPMEKKGEIKTLFQGGLLDDKGDIVRDPGLPDYPTVKEIYQKIYGKAPSGIAWDTFKGLIAAMRNYQNALVLSPGVPMDIVRAYWDASDRLMKDADWRKEAAQMVGERAPWLWGESFSKEYKANLLMDSKALDWLKTAVKQYGGAIE